MSRESTFRWLVALALLVALLVWIQEEMGWNAVLAAWSRIGPGDLAVASVGVVSGYLVRAWRLSVHFGEPVRGAFGRALRVMALHNALNNLLPARTGELSFPLLLRREFGIDAARSLGSLLWLRLLDLLVLVAIGAATLGARRFGAAAALVTLAALALPAFLVRFGADASGAPGGWRARLLAGLPGDRSVALRTEALTVLHWGSKLFAYAWLLRRFGAVPAGTAVLGAIGGELTSVLPIHGLAGAGTYEAGVMLVLRPLGIELEPAISAAVNLHVFLLVTSLVFGAAALVFRPAAGRV